MATFFSPFGNGTPRSGSGPSSAAISLGNIGAGVSDIFVDLGELTQAQGAAAEAHNYGLAPQLAWQNAQYTAMSTQEAQQQREITSSLGRTQSEVAGGGFSLSA